MLSLLYLVVFCCVLIVFGFRTGNTELGAVRQQRPVLSIAQRFLFFFSFDADSLIVIVESTLLSRCDNGYMKCDVLKHAFLRSVCYRASLAIHSDTDENRDSRMRIKKTCSYVSKGYTLSRIKDGLKPYQLLLTHNTKLCFWCLYPHK